jgi:two-component system nitrogen regulation response regulator NtrX
MLVDTFLEKLYRQSSGKKKTISDRALRILMTYDWQGNVRELKNLVERLFIMVESDRIDTPDIPQPYHLDVRPVEIIEKEVCVYENDLNLAKKRFEKEFIKQKISQEGGDLTLAAKKLGTSVKYIKKTIARDE